MRVRSKNGDEEEAPKFKLQAPEKLQGENAKRIGEGRTSFRDWSLEFPWSLDFGAWNLMPYIDQFLAVLTTEGASDLHIAQGQPPKMRKHGDVAPIRPEAVTRDEAAYMLSEMAGPANWALFEERGDLDFAYEMDRDSRFRCNFLKQANGYGAVFRLIPTKIASLEELGIPPAVKEFGHLHGGLVLVTGPTGSGKSTTLAALIDYINANFSRHIVTVEEPIEFVHENKRSIITQREVPTDTVSFPAGLKAALREDADIVLVGEMRDLETISLALTAAETGLLVFGTLHTNNARKTVDRMVDVFPANKQAQARTMLANSLRGIVAQLLLKKADESGRVAVNEILIGNAAVAAIIREGATQKLQDVILSGKGQGMQFMDDAIWTLLQQGVVSPHEAFMKAIDKNLFKKFLPAEEQGFANSAGAAPDDEKRDPGNFVKGKQQPARR
jgi:twitching motility protein PilT